MDEKKVREAIELITNEIDTVKKIIEPTLLTIVNRNIELYRTAIEALEKQLPKKIYEKQQKYSKACKCTNCKNTMIFKYETGYFCGIRYNFCPNCGQKLDWSE